MLPEIYKTTFKFEVETKGMDKAQYQEAMMNVVKQFLDDHDLDDHASIRIDSKKPVDESTIEVILINVFPPPLRLVK